MSEEAQKARLEALQKDVSEIKEATRKMAEALERLARLEERQSNISTSLERAFSIIGKVQDRVTNLELSQPVQRIANNWVFDSAKVLAGAFVMFLLKKSGIF